MESYHPFLAKEFEEHDRRPGLQKNSDYSCGTAPELHRTSLETFMRFMLLYSVINGSISQLCFMNIEIRRFIFNPSPRNTDKSQVLL